MKKLLHLFLLPLLLSACKKEKDRPEPPTQYMPQELKDYMLFKTGSYWVYQDSATAELDSVVVTADSTFIHEFYDPEVNAVTKVQEMYTLDTYSFYNGKRYMYETGLRCWYPNFTNQDFCYVIGRNKKDANPFNDLGWTRSFFYQPRLGDLLNSGFNIVSVGAIYDSLQIGSNTYSHVIRMDDTANGTENGWPTRFYITKYYGIIRKEIDCHAGRKVWNLVRSQLTQ